MNVVSQDRNSPALPDCAQHPYPCSSPSPHQLLRETRGWASVCNLSSRGPSRSALHAHMASRIPAPCEESGLRGQGCVSSQGCCGTCPLSARLQTAQTYSLEVPEAGVQDSHRWTKIKALAEPRCPGGSRGSRSLLSRSWGLSAHFGSWPHRSRASRTLYSIFTPLYRLVILGLHLSTPPRMIQPHLIPGSFI